LSVHLTFTRVADVCECRGAQAWVWNIYEGQGRACVGLMSFKDVKGSGKFREREANVSTSETDPRPQIKEGFKAKFELVGVLEI